MMLIPQNYVFWMRRVRRIRREKFMLFVRDGWSRFSFASFKVRDAERKADYLLHKLKIFRDKVAKTRQNVNRLTTEVKEATTDYSQYGKE